MQTLMKCRTMRISSGFSLVAKVPILEFPVSKQLKAAVLIIMWIIQTHVSESNKFPDEITFI